MKLSLLLYDKQKIFKENYSFIKHLLRNSFKGFIVSIVYIGVLILLDFFAREIKVCFCTSTNNNLNLIADFIIKINNAIGVKFITYFKDVIVMAAGLLGVILGLFYTTFFNIITSKYSDINSTIINQLLEQKVINNYFKLLAILVSSSIIFQFLLTIGYSPTFISSSIFSISIILALLAFIFFGRYSIIYFNAGYLVFDLIQENNNALNRGYKNKKYYSENNNGYQIISGISNNIEKIRLIVEESSKPQMTNTALDSISNELLNFSLRFNNFKHTFPSQNGWHIKIQRHKRWDEATSTDFQLFNKIGASLFPETIDDYFYIEKQIINTQFFIFNQTLNRNNKVNLIYNQSKFIQIISSQCDIELFNLFFNNLDSLIEKNLNKTGDKVNEENLQFVSLYATLLLLYLVGFNNNIEHLVSKNKIKKLANEIHNFKDIDNVMSYPYKVRIWLDKYQEKLRNEKFNEQKIITPLFFTEFELAHQFQYIFKSHIEDVSVIIHSRILEFSKKLKDSKLYLEALEFLIESLDVYNKVIFFSGIVENSIKNELNTLNLKEEKEFKFESREALLNKNNKFREKVIETIWNYGFASYNIKKSELPDIFGNFYNLICKDILDKAFNNKSVALVEYLSKFYACNLLYIDYLRGKIDDKNFEFTSSKLFPVIVDLFEISSLAILLSKANSNVQIIESFFNFWDTAFENSLEKEKQYWSFILSIYDYFNQPIFGLSTPSYIKEHERRQKFEKFIKESSFVRIERDEGPFKSFMQHYVTDIDDIYFKEIISHLSVNGYGDLRSDDLAEIFIEYFLRTRVVLKELNIKETRYGRNIRRHMEKDSQ